MRKEGERMKEYHYMVSVIMRKEGWKRAFSIALTVR
jgi:hypothetical protein